MSYHLERFDVGWVNTISIGACNNDKNFSIARGIAIGGSAPIEIMDSCYF